MESNGIDYGHVPLKILTSRVTIQWLTRKINVRYFLCNLIVLARVRWARASSSLRNLLSVLMVINGIKWNHYGHVLHTILTSRVIIQWLTRKIGVC